ncbi:unnamed protein product [Rotaria magnacalcarata]|uniref:Uncharacterized protein n=1 Tax=Rotaria magnacalcarata TaxID=392030 RepID=A0A816N5S0_9BILA|nr:unnamed protein product [Rotaria magnacalcarata]
MIYHFTVLFSIIILITCQQNEDIVECNNQDLSQYYLDKINPNEQEQFAYKILHGYDRNLTTLAYITASAEFESHLHQNDTSKVSAMEKYYDAYRNCLKTVAIIGRQLKNSIDHPNASLRWLLIRTQAIGDAAQNDTTVKFDMQKLKALIKKIYRDKFSWNNTEIAIDEVQEIMGGLKSPDDLLSLWKATYDAPAPMRHHYSALIALQNQQAKQNRTSATFHKYT